MDENDPTRVRNQSSLTTSTGRIWLVIGGILAVVSVVVLLAQIRVDATLAFGGAIVVAALYAAMVVVRFTVRALPRRLGTLAILLIVLVVVALATLLLIVLTA